MRFYREVNSHLGAEYQMAFRLPGPEPLRIVRDDWHDPIATSPTSERDLCELLRSPLAAIHASATREALLHETVEHHVASDHTAALIACEGDRLVALDDRAAYLVARLQTRAPHTDETFTAWLHQCSRRRRRARRPRARPPPHHLDRRPRITRDPSHPRP